MGDDREVQEGAGFDSPATKRASHTRAECGTLRQQSFSRVQVCGDAAAFQSIGGLNLAVLALVTVRDAFLHVLDLLFMASAFPRPIGDQVLDDRSYFGVTFTLCS